MLFWILINAKDFHWEIGLMKFLSIFIGVKINLVLWKIYEFKSEQKSSQVHRLELQNNLGSRAVMWIKGGGGGGIVGSSSSALRSVTASNTSSGQVRAVFCCCFFLLPILSQLKAVI